MISSANNLKCFYFQLCTNVAKILKMCMQILEGSQINFGRITTLMGSFCAFLLYEVYVIIFLTVFNQYFPDIRKLGILTEL